jgi:hypothetical protein
MEDEGQPGDTAMEKGESGVMEKGESGMENEGQPGDAAIEHAEGNRDYAGLPDSLDAEMQGTRRAEEEGMEPGECRMQNAE